MDAELKAQVKYARKQVRATRKAHWVADAGHVLPASLENWRTLRAAGARVVVLVRPRTGNRVQEVWTP